MFIILMIFLDILCLKKEIVVTNAVHQTIEPTKIPNGKSQESVIARDAAITIKDIIVVGFESVRRKV